MAKVRLIREGEKLIWRDPNSDATITYRRPKSQFVRQVQAKHTDKGVTNNSAVMDELLAWAILDWSGYVDENDNELAWDPAYIEAIPELHKADFVSQLYAVCPEAAQLKN